MSAEKFPPVETSSILGARLLEPIQFPELFFGIVAPIGVDTQATIRSLHESLRGVGYETTLIKITSLMKDIPTTIELVESPLEDRYDRYIKYANLVRERLNIRNDKTAGNDSLAMLAVAAILNAREQKTGAKDKPSHKRAYIIDQFKRPEEVLLFRRLYGRLFVQISVHATRSTRCNTLKRSIRKSHADAERDFTVEAEDLIRRDLTEEDQPHGQRVRDAFPMADVTIDGNDKNRGQREIDRFIRLFFGYNFITPTHDEHGMFIAKSAALRSADLSRQVGAALFSETGETITLGANEVPKPGGGTYFEGDNPDHRDFVQGEDYNEQEKLGIVREFVRRLDDAKCLTFKATNIPTVTLEDKVQYVLEDERGPKLKDARVMDLLEFGRQIHAEMNAICDASRLGRPTKGATLYCATFPCHMCMKLILGAGIRRVVYIEPYPKSFAEEMYSHSIAIEQKDGKDDRVLVEPFTGVAPLRYKDLFEKRRRKTSGGIAQEWMETPPRPNINLLVESYLELEVRVIAELGQRLASLR